MREQVSKEGANTYARRKAHGGWLGKVGKGMHGGDKVGEAGGGEVVVVEGWWW